MEAVVVGALTGVTIALAAVLWYLLVRPDALLALRGGGATAEDGWFDEHPVALWALRWVVALVLFLLGFLTGLATAFLGSTA